MNIVIRTYARSLAVQLSVHAENKEKTGALLLVKSNIFSFTHPFRESSSLRPVDVIFFTSAGALFYNNTMKFRGYFMIDRVSLPNLLLKS